jgi:hypothetical protein
MAGLGLGRQLFDVLLNYPAEATATPSPSMHLLFVSGDVLLEDLLKIQE